MTREIMIKDISDRLKRIDPIDTQHSSPSFIRLLTDEELLYTMDFLSRGNNPKDLGNTQLS